MTYVNVNLTAEVFYLTPQMELVWVGISLDYKLLTSMI